MQTATTVQYSDGLTSDMIQFQSDVPEPSYTALLALGILGCWFRRGVRQRS